MSNQSLGERVLERLAQAAQSGLLPAAAQDEAEKLLARLQSPVRLALLGMPGSGKSSLLNLLAGDIVLPEGVRLPTVQLSYGVAPRAICTLSDGTKQTLETADCQKIAALSPVFVEIELPLPALAKISLLETVAPNDPNALHRAGQWAAKRADVVLWCTSEFDTTERRIWGQMPDLIKDYALLMVTRMDVLQEQGTLDGIIGSIRTAAIGEFEKILPINVPMALKARKPDGTVDKDLMRESGGMALIAAVLKQVEQENRSAVDMADVLLLQNTDALAGMDAAEAATTEEPAVSEDAATAATNEPAVSPGIARLREIAARRAAEQTQPAATATR